MAIGSGKKWQSVIRFDGREFSLVEVLDYIQTIMKREMRYREAIRSRFPVSPRL